MKTNLFIRVTVLCIIALFVCNVVKCQDNTNVKKVSILPVPVIGYTPETKTYLGAVTLFTINNAHDSLTRTSNAKIEFNYTWNKQLIIESGWNYFFSGEEWFTRGVIHCSKYPDLYYGIGFNTPESGEIKFQSNRLILELDAFRNIKNKIFWGLGINHESFGNIEYLNDKLIYPELKDESKYGIRFLFLNDSRNNILSPSEGNYFEFSNSFNMGSSFYFKTAMDYRNYFGFGKKGEHTFAGRFYHTSIWGNPPFFDYAVIGGDEYARGYYFGRFIDKNISSVQLEYRVNLFWRIGVATFGGISVVYDKINSIKNESFKPNAGIGLRFLADKRENIHLRIDYAFGAQNQSGFYISFGESF